MPNTDPRKRPDIRRRLMTALLLCLPVMVTGQVTGERHDPGIDLPEDDGRARLVAACTACHDLTGLPAYRNYWNRDRWRSMVDSMVENGAPLDEAGRQVVTEYLARHFGTATQASEEQEKRTEEGTNEQQE